MVQNHVSIHPLFKTKSWSTAILGVINPFIGTSIAFKYGGFPLFGMITEKKPHDFPMFILCFSMFEFHSVILSRKSMVISSMAILGT